MPEARHHNAALCVMQKKYYLKDAAHYCTCQVISYIIYVIGIFLMQKYHLCSFLSLYLRGKEKEMNQRKRKHANDPCISLTLNAKILFELKAQILSRLTIALCARSPDSPYGE